MKLNTVFQEMSADTIFHVFFIT